MVRVIPRFEWKAEPPKQTQPLIFPCRSVVFHYTETDKCLNFFDCCKVVRSLQQAALEKGLADIPYNFLVSGDLNVYEGRGWNHRVFERKLVIGYIARSTDQDDKMQDMDCKVGEFLKQNDNKVKCFQTAEVPENLKCTHNYNATD